MEREVFEFIFTINMAFEKEITRLNSDTAKGNHFLEIKIPKEGAICNVD